MVRGAPGVIRLGYTARASPTIQLRMFVLAADRRAPSLSRATAPPGGHANARSGPDEGVVAEASFWELK